MDRNEITRRSLLGGALALPLASLAARATAQQPAPPSGPFSLPPLAYPFTALEPHIDALTMQIHHDRHHQTYITNLNAAMAKVFGPNTRVMSAEVLLKRLERIPEESRTAVRNNAGGHVNHTLFWSSMKPAGGGAPTGPIADAIKGTFGDFDKFKAAFEDAGLKRFGSGWVWLYIKQGKLAVGSYANQDNPLIDGDIPLLGNDVWEHAYYLKYQNKRADYLKAWWNVVNWDEVNKRFKDAL